MAILFPVKSEMAILFFVKRDPGPPFTTLILRTVQNEKSRCSDSLLRVANINSLFERKTGKWGWNLANSVPVCVSAT